MRTVHRLVTRQGRQQPFVMILEDMQWVDSETHAAMDALVEALPPYTLVASTYRPEYVDRWSRHPGYTQVRVDALEPPATGDMLDALLGDEPGLTPLKRLVAERANGNPLFLEECVTTLVETGALAGERGRLPPHAPRPRARGPGHRAGDHRLAHRPAALRGQAAAAGRLGHRRRGAGAPARDRRRRARRRGAPRARPAPRRGPARQRALFPDLEYGFRHALVHDVAYESLLHERRRTPARAHPGGHRAVPTRAAGWPSRPSGSPTTPSSARRGSARWATAARPAAGCWRGWRAGRACPSSSGPSPRSPTGRRTR